MLKILVLAGNSPRNRRGGCEISEGGWEIAFRNVTNHLGYSNH